MKQNWVAIGGVFGIVAVLFGAFGAHGLETRITPHLLDVYKTGAYYQMVHALALILIGIRMDQHPRRRHLSIACTLLAAGTIVFSGSLYLLAVSSERRWGMVTPLGGLSFISGWALFIWSEIRGRSSK